MYSTKAFLVPERRLLLRFVAPFATKIGTIWTIPGVKGNDSTAIRAVNAKFGTAFPTKLVSKRVFRSATGAFFL